ncbi:hypothetical protein T05_4746 [Trichinella murrelli]|uniref:Uncharacterized protein n=1 Tax=Trichinella murrelli TaxID=144512 RepID=A0A0V0TML9_9BILA|nr:hypothetical protein T05_4746 [Trichinella murrelli]
MLSDHSVWLPELRFVTPVRCCIRDLLHLYYCVGKFLRSVSKLMTCTRRAAEELKTIPQIYHEEASSASADLESVGNFPTYKSVKTAMYRRRVQKFSRLPPTRQ